MSTQVQRRRGTTAEHATFTGAAGEITVDTTKKTAVVHDGSTAGGFPLQKEDAELSAIAGLTSSADRLPYFTGSGTASLATFTAAGRALLDDADASAQRTTLGLGTAATQPSSAFEVAGAAADVASDLATHEAGTTVHGISSFGATLVDDADAATARATLGLVIGTNVQAQDAELAAIAGLSSAADRGIYFTGSGTASLFTLTSYGRALVAATDAAAARTELGLGTLATQSGTFSGTSSGTNTGDQTISLTGDVTGSGTGSFAATIANGVVTYAKMQDVSATDRILGRSSSGSGDVEEIPCTAAARSVLDDASVSAMVDTLGGSAATGTGGLVRANSPTLVTPALGTPSSGTLTNCTGLPTAGHVDDSVTFAKMQNIATDRLIGRDTASSGDPEEVSVGGGLEFTGTGGIQRSALTGDVTASAGSGSTTIANGAVSLAKMADLAQDQFIGRTTASTGVPQTATITAAARTVLDDTTVGAMVDTLGGASSTGSGGLVRATSPALTTPNIGTPSAGTLTNCTGLPTAGLVNDAVSDAKLRNSGACSVIGRSANSSGDPADISAGTNGTLLGRVGDALVFVRRALDICFNAVSSANINWTNLPSSNQFLGNSHRHIRKVDLSDYTQVRLTLIRMDISASAGSKVGLFYRTSFSTTAADYSSIGTSAVEIAIDAATDTAMETSWIDLATLARADVYLSVQAYGGDGTVTPRIGYMAAQFR